MTKIRHSNELSENQKFEKACRFVIRLGTLAHQYGTQSKRLDTFLTQVIKSLGFNGIFRSTPTEISFTFISHDDMWHKPHLVTFPGTGYDLNKMAKLDMLVSKLIHGTISLDHAIEILSKIEKSKQPYNKLLVAIGYATAGAGYTMYMQYGTLNILLSAILSIVVFWIVLKSSKFSERFELATPVLCAFVTGTIAALCSVWIPGLQVYIITLAAVIYLIPGFSISNGVIELTNKYIVSGMTNIISGLFYMVLLFSGAWVGISMISYFFSLAKPQEIHTSAIWIWPGLLMLVVGLCIIFQTPPRDFFWAILGCIITCFGISIGMKMNNIDIGNFLGTVFAVIYSNSWSRKTNRASSIVLLPAIVLLVSGSVGFRGIVNFTYGNTNLGQHQFAHMFIVAATIAMGLILGNSISKDKTTL